MSCGNASAKGKAVAAAGSPDYPASGGGGGSAETSGHSRSAWYGSSGEGSGGAGPSNVQRVGYPSWNVGAGDGSAGGGSVSTEPFSLYNNGYACHGADGYVIAGGGAVDRHAVGMSGGSVGYGSGGGAGAGYGGWCGSAEDWHAPGYGMEFFHDNGGFAGGSGSGRAPFPSPHVSAGMYPPQNGRMGYRHTGGGVAVDGHFEFLPGNGSASLPSPRIGTDTYDPRHALLDYYYSYTGVADQHPELLHMSGNGGGGGGANFRSPAMGAQTCVPRYEPNRCRPRSPFQRCTDDDDIEDLIASSLRALTIGHRSDNLLAGGHRRLSGFLNQGHAPPLNAGRHDDAPFPDPYAAKRLDDVRGCMSRVARDLHGCQFLVRTVAEGGAAAARQVFDEVACEVVRLMGDAVGHALVEKLATFWTDEEITRVLGVLGTATTRQIVAAATNHSGSSILQMLVARIAGQPGHLESFARTLAGIGENGVRSLIEDISGSHLILKCLETSSADQNQFIVDVVVKFFHQACLHRHGCEVITQCIDKAGDDQATALVHAVCRNGLALAEHCSGNYLVQHVIESVPAAPWAKDSLHRSFRGQYVSLSRQKAGSHVVQRCLEFFSRDQVDEIVTELLRCRQWHFEFQELISDPYANYVLQTAMERTQGQMRNTLLYAISRYGDAVREDRFAKMVLQKLRAMRRSYR